MARINKIRYFDYTISPYRPCPQVLKEMKKSINFVNKYPSYGTQKLKEEIGKYCACSPHNVLISDGVDRLISLIAYSLLSEGDNVIILTPCFRWVYDVSRINGAETRLVNMHTGTDFILNEDSVLSNIDKNTKLIWITNPNNPTGKLIPKDKIDKIVDSTSAIVVIDETFHEYASNDPRVTIKKNVVQTLIIHEVSQLRFLLADRRKYRRQMVNRIYAMLSDYALKLFFVRRVKKDKLARALHLLGWLRAVPGRYNIVTAVPLSQVRHELRANLTNCPSNKNLD